MLLSRPRLLGEVTRSAGNSLTRGMEALGLEALFHVGQAVPRTEVVHRKTAVSKQPSVDRGQLSLTPPTSRLLREAVTVKLNRRVGTMLLSRLRLLGEVTR